MQRTMHKAGVFPGTLHILHKLLYALKFKMTAFLVLSKQYHFIISIIAFFSEMCIRTRLWKVTYHNSVDSITLHSLDIVWIFFEQIIEIIAFLKLILEDHYCILLLFLCHRVLDYFLHIITIIHSAGVWTSAALCRNKLGIKELVCGLTRAIPKLL